MNNITIGEHTYTGSNFRVLWNKPESLGNNIIPKLIIGKFCSIADNLTIYLGGNHPTNFITTYPLHTKLCDQPNSSWKEHLSNGDVIIENDVWIGDNVTIFSGSRIENGAIIGANSVVRNQIDPYSINYGNPCKFIVDRFSEKEIIKLFRMQWWNWPIEKIKEATNLLEWSNVESLYEFYLKNIKK